MAMYTYPGYETGQGWTMKPGNLEWGFWGKNKQILGAKPPIFPYISPRIPPQDSQVSLSNPGLFHTLVIYIEPSPEVSLEAPQLLGLRASRRPNVHLLESTSQQGVPEIPEGRPERGDLKTDRRFP